MKASKLCLATLGMIAVCVSTSCNDDADDDGSNLGAADAGQAGAGGSGGSSNGGSAAGKGGATTSAGTSGGGQAGTGGNPPEQGGAPNHEGGAPFAEAGTAGAESFPEECGDPKKDGVLVYQDITEDTSWSCPVYTLTQPIYVHGDGSEPTLLHIDPGVTVRGVKGAEPVKLPGALIVTRSGRLEAVGNAQHPIVFTTAVAADAAAPGSWGGLMLLGRAAINVPADFEASGRPAGEAYAEALPRTELGLYGSPSADGAGGAPAQPNEDDESWSCGTLKYVRIDFAGFKAGSTKELNGLTLGGCGSDTVIDHVQVHRSSDDGIEIFGGTVSLKHIVLTGNQDDSLDWDQGWRGKAQFVAVQTHDDADTGDSCGVEADGYATPDAPVGLPSSPRIWNMTLILSKNTQRGVRFRDGTRAFVGNAILAAHAQGVAKGLLDIDHVRTADQLATGNLSVQHSIFRGSWPAAGQADTLGTVYLEQDFFTGNGPGATGNDVIAAASDLWLNAFNVSAPEWVPGADSPAKDDAVAPSDVDGSSFFDVSANYRGAFAPGGDDWTAGWTSYP